MARAPGSLRTLWYQWKMLQLPWRRRWLVGFDLEGNTYWEFKDALHSLRTRRIVKYGRGTHHGDVQVPPLWMQWLRHTRFEPPTVSEQQANVIRQQQMKILAAEADARWAAKPSVLDAPDKQQPVHMLESRHETSGIKESNAQSEIGDDSEPLQNVEDVNVAASPSSSGQPSEGTPTVKKSKMKTQPKDSPWKQPSRSNPGEDWQPESWTPGPARRRS
ncbi:hypothetical protein EJ04DRAFT_488716 [Polyplosphaeria fusca]|uniref:NADH dehydrogenase [ubiquinone] 1 alpha subcomplex subunit n=1 Tax=Polyplosphaeria fusca TaxID=682080 RepID=A0A9P4V643_9PLEO|nr:hypothetical protein EJ04DRAFT_488716 [Polyplosphaeria fusca]